MMATKNFLFQNGIASTVQKVVRIAEQLLLVPFFIMAWGVDFYGEWITLTMVPAMLAFSDMGFGASAANRFVLQFLAGKTQEAANTIRSGFVVVSIIATGMMLLAAGVLYLLDCFNVFHYMLFSRAEAIAVLMILMAARVLNFFQQLYDGHFRATRRAALGIHLHTFFSILTIVAGLLVLIPHKGPVYFALAQLVASALFTVYFVIRARKLLTNEFHTRGKVVVSDMKTIASLGFGYFLSPIWQGLFMQGTTFAVRVTLGPIAVAVFETVRTLTKSINHLFNLVTLTVFPEMQFELGAGNMPRVRQLYRAVLSSLIGLSIIGVGILLVEGTSIYGWWTKWQLTATDGLWYVFVFSMLVNAAWWSTVNVYVAYNKPYRYTFPALLATCITVPATYLLALHYGLAGAAVGCLLLDVILAVALVPDVLRMLKK